MKTTAKKILLIVLMIVTTTIIAFANVSEKMVSVSTVYDNPGYEAFSTDYQIHTECLPF